MDPKWRVIADTSNHNLPIGALVSRTYGPKWSVSEHWYTQGGVGDEVAINPSDLERFW